MKKYAVELGEELGQILTEVASKRDFPLTALVRFILWQHLDSRKNKQKSGKS